MLPTLALVQSCSRIDASETVHNCPLWLLSLHVCAVGRRMATSHPVRTLVGFSLLLWTVGLGTLLVCLRGGLDAFSRAWRLPPVAEEHQHAVSALVAVGAVQLVILAYVVHAWREPASSEAKGKQRKKGE